MKKSPLELLRQKRNVYFRSNIFTHYVGSTIQRIVDFPLEKYFKKYYPQLKKMQDIHRNKRCFIIGTGPSLNETNLSLVKNEFSFGLNTLYKGMNKFGIKPNYWVVADHVVFREIYEELGEIDITLFLTRGVSREFCKYYKKYSKSIKNPILIRGSGRLKKNKNFGNIQNGIAGKTGSVVFDALQIAYHMGFSEVYLIGCDCDYSKGHHFDNKTHDCEKGRIPFEEKEEFDNLMASYLFFKKLFEKNGRKIYNSTVGGKLEVFERKSIEEIMDV